MPSGIYKRKKENYIKVSQKLRGHPCWNLMVGKDNPSWKGDGVKYRALHEWVERKLGKPQFCEHCGNRNLKQRQYHWANVSGEYKRDILDWIRLCVKCHSKYDNEKHG